MNSDNDDMFKKPGPLSSDPEPEPEPNMGPHEPFPAKFKLRRIEPLENNVEADTAGYVYRGVEFEPSPNKKYVFAIEVGDTPPKEVQMILNQAHRALKKFVPEGSLVVPCRHGMPAVAIYEITKEE